MTVASRLSFIFTLAIALIALARTTLPDANAQIVADDFSQANLNFNGITSATTKCANFPAYHDVTVQYAADVATVNTTTLEVRYSLINGFYSTGGVLSSAITADTPAVATGNISHVVGYNGQFCLTATPVNTYPITVTASLIGYK